MSRTDQAASINAVALHDDHPIYATKILLDSGFLFDSTSKLFPTVNKVYLQPNTERNCICSFLVCTYGVRPNPGN